MIVGSTTVGPKLEGDPFDNESNALDCKTPEQIICVGYSLKKSMYKYSSHVVFHKKVIQEKKLGDPPFWGLIIIGEWMHFVSM